MMGERDGLFVPTVTGSYRLGVEELRVDEVDVFRRGVYRRCDELFR